MGVVAEGVPEEVEIAVVLPGEGGINGGELRGQDDLLRQIEQRGGLLLQVESVAPHARRRPILYQ